MTCYNENQNEYNYDEEARSASILRLTMLGVCVITPAITPGMSMGYAAVALPQLNLTVHETSWFASIGSVATPIGNMFTGIIIDKYGRKPTLILATVPSIVGWSILAWCSNARTSLGWMYIGQIFNGFALGATSLPSSIYAAECITINNENLRGSLMTWTTLALSSGVVLVYVLGSVMRYDRVALVSSAISIIALLLITIFIPESPSWLYRQGRMTDARRSQNILSIRQPLSLLSSSSTDDTTILLSKKEKIFRPKYYYYFFVDKLSRKDIYKPLLLTVTLLFGLQFSGVYVLTAYMVNIVNVDTTAISPYILAVIGGTLHLIGIILITFIIPYSGIRKLLILSSTGVSIGMFLLSTSSVINYISIGKFVRINAIWLTVFTSGLGFTAFPFSLLGELFPADAKGFACIPLIASSFFNFVVLNSYPYLVLLVGSCVYFMYFVFSLLTALFVLVFLPETVGKSMQEITDEFNRIPAKSTYTTSRSRNRHAYT